MTVVTNRAFPCHHEPERTSAQQRRELVQAAYRLLRLEAQAPQQSRERIERFLELLAPSVIFCVEGGQSYVGRHALRRLLLAGLRDWASVSYQLDQLEHWGADRLLAVGRVLARPPERSSPGVIPFHNLWIWNLGQVVRLESLSDQRPASPIPEGRRSGLVFAKLADWRRWMWR